MLCYVPTSFQIGKNLLPLTEKKSKKKKKKEKHAASTAMLYHE